MGVELIGFARDGGDEVAGRLTAEIHPLAGRARSKAAQKGDDSDPHRQSSHRHHPERIYPLGAGLETPGVVKGVTDQPAHWNTARDSRSVAV
ncbi:hypothetical protein MGAD_02640 [Mycolicibacterium gadium]|uniref:Uncharacterized protein n=1 Tax=Mycolicibacterium gadium TaxID=1794 RepID=A0A7I7WEE4_MYCGU|nr:hypothetical protein MGAD_02640 [Mycolicibacterium gadium]